MCYHLISQPFHNCCLIQYPTQGWRLVFINGTNRTFLNHSEDPLKSHFQNKHISSFFSCQDSLLEKALFLLSFSLCFNIRFTQYSKQTKRLSMSFEKRTEATKYFDCFGLCFCFSSFLLSQNKSRGLHLPA